MVVWYALFFTVRRDEATALWKRIVQAKADLSLCAVMREGEWCAEMSIYEKKETCFCANSLLVLLGWRVGLEPTTFRTTI